MPGGSMYHIVTVSSANPYGPPGQPGAAVRKGRPPWLIAVLTCGGCFVLLAIALAIGTGFLVRLGFGLFADAVADDLRDHPVITTHLGELEELEIDWMESMMEPGEDDFVFQARGSEGSGTLRVTSLTLDDDTEDVVAGTLELESGETFDLFPDAVRPVEAPPP